MAMTENEEEKRSKLWRNVLIIATIVIIFATGYFLYQGFFGNPALGKWYCEDNDVVLEIKKKDKAVVYLSNLSSVKIKMRYKLNATDKEITLSSEPQGLQDALKEIDDPDTASLLESTIYSLGTTFHYKIENNEMELTEWDYGDQMVFSFTE